MTPPIACELPQELLATLCRDDASARVPAEQRESALSWLRCVLVDFTALDRHVRLLMSLYDSPFCYPRPRREGHGLEPATTPTKFRFTDRLPDARICEVLERGVEALDNEELGWLLLNPFATYDLYDVISEACPDAWLPIMQQVGREMMRRKTPAPPASSPVLTVLPAKNGQAMPVALASRRGVPWARVRLPALAAGLLLSVLTACTAVLIAARESRDAADARRQLALIQAELIKRDSALASVGELRKGVIRLQTDFSKSKLPLHEIWASSYIKGASVADNLQRLHENGPAELKRFIDEKRQAGRPDFAILTEIQLAAEQSKKE